VADGTGISWTDATWNPVRGCSRMSEGCRNCYAERVAARFSDPGMPYHGLARRVLKTAGASQPRWTGDVRMVHEHLADPLRWRKPRRIFVNSMSDVFHEKLTNEQIAAVFGVMAAAPQHTFQVLTKRAKRMREWFEWMSLEENFSPNATMHVEAAPDIDDDDDNTICERILDADWPLPNVWLGVSVESQTAADERIPELLATPAAVRFLSCEPLIERVNLCHLDNDAVGGEWCQVNGLTGEQTDMGRPCPSLVNRIDWVIAGCESGPGARPCDVDWLRSLRDQCTAAHVPFFLKQAVEQAVERAASIDAIVMGTGSKRKGCGLIELPYLDGVQHADFPRERA